MPAFLCKVKMFFYILSDIPTAGHAFRKSHQVAFSNLNGYLRFKLSPQLKQRDPKFELVENGLQKAKRSDGFFGLRIGGTLRTPRPFPSPIAPGPPGARPGRGSRPGLSGRRR